MTGPAARAIPLERLAGAARRDLAVWALALAGVLGALAGDLLTALPQGLAAAASWRWGRRVEVLRLGLAGRLGVLAACAGVGLGPVGLTVAGVARFLSVLCATTLVRPRGPSEQGYLLVLLLVEAALAAGLADHWTSGAAAIVLVAAAHRAVGSWHRWRSAARAAGRGGPLVAADDAGRLARTADGAAVACLLASVPLFLVLPRADIPLLALPAALQRSEPGVGEEVRLGSLGPLAGLDEVVGRAAPANAAARAAAPYFRCVVMDDFDGGGWVASRPPSARWDAYDAVSGLGVVRGRAAGSDAPRWSFVVEAAAGGRLPLPERTAQVRFRDPLPTRVLRDSAGTVRPQAPTPPARWSYEAVASETARPALADDGPTAAHRARPKDPLRGRLAPAVAEVLRGRAGASARERALALAAWVEGSARYDLVGGPGGPDPVGDFLFRARRGHCEHFASALVLALREGGIPARFVAGYLASRWNDVGGFWVLRRRDAHAWVEAWLGEEGWVRLDATPASARSPDPYSGPLGWLVGVRDALSFAWNRHVLGFDAAAQRALAGGLARAGREAWERAGGGAVGFAAGALVAAGVAFAAARAARRRGRAGRTARPRLAFYARALTLLARRGVRRGPAETPMGLLGRARRALSPPAAEALGRLTAAFEASRYGGAPPPSDPECRAWLSRL